ncbi:sensor histidine kinase [Clostridium cuniculi]|uniref:sensor histidine kinase n=1 Tax=Clostridium cuniculi TaxID=2548455 RepID=UPI001056A28A|nr:sensor histidine kinase [Clostridium cuniculi]
MKRKLLLILSLIVISISILLVYVDKINLDNKDVYRYINKLNKEYNENYDEILNFLDKKIDSNLSERERVKEYLARINFLYESNKFDELLDIAIESEKILIDQQEWTFAGSVECLIAQLYLQRGDYEWAYIYSNKSNIILMDLYDKNKLDNIYISQLVQVKSIKAVTEQEFNMNEEADTSFKEIQNILENYDVEISSYTYANIAEYYKGKNLFDKVEEYVQKAYERIQLEDCNNYMLDIKLNILLATTYYKNEEYEKALELLNNIDIEKENLYTVDKFIVIGEILSQQNNIDGAIENFEYAYNILLDKNISRKILYVIDRLLQLNKDIGNKEVEEYWLDKLKFLSIQLIRENPNYHLINKVNEINLNKISSDLAIARLNQQIYIYLSIILVISIFILIIIVMFRLKEKELHKRVLQKNIDVLNKQLQYKLKYYKSEKKREDEIKRYIHDRSNHMRILIGLIENGENQRAIDYMSELTDTYKNMQKNSVTKNKVIDSILSNLIEECKQKNIKLDLDIKLPEEIQITDIDLCIIFSNLIDNAIEACEKLNNSSQKIINLKSNISGNYMYVSIENSYDGEISKNGVEFITWKKNKKFHGVGLENIGITVNKYKGMLKYDYNESIFKVSVLLNIK